jgi:hypothetical protein
LLVWFLIYWAKQDSMGFVASIAWVIAGVMAIIALLAFYLLGWFLDRRGERYQALAAADAMNQDLRPPVLYFRSFFDEPRTRRIRTRAGSSVEYDYSFSEEEYLRAEILKAGPFVAVGRPGDPLPQLGANRLYVDDADWQAAVLRLMDGAAGAVIRVGSGEGLSWEIRQAVLRFPPERLVFVVPRDPHQYSWFKAEIDPYLPRPLPWYPDVEARNWFDRARQVRFQLLGFLYFASDWSGYFELFSFPQEGNGVKFWIGDGARRTLPPTTSRPPRCRRSSPVVWRGSPQGCPRRGTSPAANEHTDARGHVASTRRRTGHRRRQDGFPIQGGSPIHPGPLRQRTGSSG